MFSPDDVRIEIDAADGDVALITIDTPVGRGEMIGRVKVVGNVLYIDKAHVDGLTAERLGRAGTNAILQRFLVEADVQRLVIQGETRSTGRFKGKRPRPVHFPHGITDRDG